MGTMAQLPPLTSRSSKPSPNVYTTVRYLSPYLTVCPRIHHAPLYHPLGKFVSESKFRQDPAAFIPHIQQGDAEALAALGKIDVDCVVDLYESYIIPLTKEVEVCGHIAAMFQQVTSVLG